jgi:DNA-directed RNA polymerase specialized sigma24 family protein
LGRFRQRGATTADTADAIPSREVVDFASAWPSVRTRLAAVLRNRGLQATDVDDIVQDVAIRALRSGPRFESEDHLVAWCCRVGINLHIDSTRRQRRLSPEAPPEAAADFDMASTVERRLALEVLAGGIAKLSEDERRLLFELEGGESRREAVRLAVRRHRLRGRLAELVEGMLAGVPLLRRWSRLTRSLSRPAKVSLATAPVVAVALVLGPLSPAGRPAETPDLSPRDQVPLVSAVPTSTPPESERASVTATTAMTGARVVPSAPPQQPAVAPRRIVDVAPAGVPVRVSSEQRPDDREPLLCGDGVLVGCIARPPGVPEHTLPSVP